MGGRGEGSDEGLTAGTWRSQLPPRERSAMGHKADLRERRTDVAE